MATKRRRANSKIANSRGRKAGRGRGLGPRNGTGPKAKLGTCPVANSRKKTKKK